RSRVHDAGAHAPASGDRTRMTPDRPTIRPERYAERIRAAQGLAANSGLAAILVGVGADMRYLTGYTATPLERLTMLVLPAEGDPAIIAPKLEEAPVRLAPPVAAGLLPVVTWEEGDDAYRLAASLVPPGASA